MKLEEYLAVHPWAEALEVLWGDPQPPNDRQVEKVRELIGVSVMLSLTYYFA